MPSGLYSWYCVAHSAARILSHAVDIEASQRLSVLSRSPSANTRKTTRKDTLSYPDFDPDANHPSPGKYTVPDITDSSKNNLHASRNIVLEENSSPSPSTPILLEVPERTLPNASQRDEHKPMKEPSIIAPAVQGTEPSHVEPEKESVAEQETSSPLRKLRTSAVPSTRVGRLFHYGGLAASLSFGTASSYLRPSSSPRASNVLSEANINRLVDKLSRMRGAALKLGQFMSIQDSNALPPELDRVFRRVHDSAHYMPNWQMEKVLRDSIGSTWNTNFSQFEPIPIAAASIGQVHRARIAASVSPSGKEEEVAVKIQFPGVRQSIESDLGILKVLLNASMFLPKGLFLDKTIAAMREELALECDYEHEASAIRLFRTHLENDARFKVPWVWEGSTREVLVMEYVSGVPMGDEHVGSASQATRNEIASRVLELCLKELFEFNAMQTDPNWSNFLWKSEAQQLQLLDFGATRYYSKTFMDKWFSLLNSAVHEDYDASVHWSKELGYLTGDESETMRNSHVESLMLLATPFRPSSAKNGLFAFGPGTEWAAITEKIRATIPIMLRERLTPPPRETYSLNRKLSGSFLLASRLKAEIDCKKLWDQTTAGYSLDRT